MTPRTPVDILILDSTEVFSLATDFAILDLQWAPHPNRLVGSNDPLLAVAASTGLLAFYRLKTRPPASDTASQQQSQTELVLSCVNQVTNDTTLVLSLTWHPVRPNVLGLTLSDGRVVLCMSEGRDEHADAAVVACWDPNAVFSMHDVHEHELEAWIMNFTPEKDEKVLSGGDDMILLCSQDTASAQTDPAEEQEYAMQWQDRKLHHAGVTAILPLSDTLVVTGSYDDHIRLLSLPAVGRRKVLAELNLGGGVWRLKLLTPPSSHVAQPSHIESGGGISSTSTADADHGSGQHTLAPPMSALQDHQDQNQTTSSHFVLLCSCMHAGTRVVRLQRSSSRKEEDEYEWTFSVIARFEEHESMNYASDVQPRSDDDVGDSLQKTTIVSTSFYDKLLCLWQIDDETLREPQQETS